MTKIRKTGFNAKEFAAKKVRPMETSTGLKNIDSVMSEKRDDEAGRGRYADILVNLIDLDPNQPRQTTKPTRDEVDMLKKQYVNFTNFLADDTTGFNPDSLKNTMPDRADVLIRFLYFAHDIEQAGLTHPINVYKSGMRYIISQGERRYLAHVLIGKNKIPAIERPHPIQNGRADELNYYVKQAGENLHREDFSVQEKLVIVQKAKEMYLAVHEHPPSVRDLSVLLHISRGAAHNYLTVLNDPTGLKTLLQDESATLKDVLGDIGVKNAPVAKPDERSTPKVARGRKAKVDLGKIENVNLVRSMMLRLDPSVVKSVDIDWTDAKAVQKQWQKLIAKLLKELK